MYQKIDAELSLSKKNANQNPDQLKFTCKKQLFPISTKNATKGSRAVHII